MYFDPYLLKEDPKFLGNAHLSKEKWNALQPNSLHIEPEPKSRGGGNS